MLKKKCSPTAEKQFRLEFIMSTFKHLQITLKSKKKSKLLKEVKDQAYQQMFFV